MIGPISSVEQQSVIARFWLTCWASTLSGTGWLALLCHTDLTEDLRFFTLAGTLVVLLCFATLPLVLLVEHLASQLGARCPRPCLVLASAALGIAASNLLVSVSVGEMGHLLHLAWPCLAVAALGARRLYHAQPACTLKQAAPLLTRWRPRARRKAPVFRDNAPLGSGC